MKKILTITCHKVYNHGASLQEYALLNYIQSLGYETKTINYQPHYLADNYSFLGVPSPKFKKNILLKAAYILAKLPSNIGNIKRQKAFNAFDEKFINETKTIYRTNAQLKANLPEADAYICGSDQIWNSKFENGKDPAFYLDFVPENKLKISYAASFAIDTIKDSLKPFVKQKVERIDAVSVREKSGIKILNDLDIDNVKHVMDPVFLLSKDDWANLFIQKNYSTTPYVLVYDFDNNPLIKQYAQYLKEEKGLKIIALGKKIKYADEIKWSIGPSDFLNLMYHADFVLANSFHATAFSFIFKKQVLIFNRNSNINTRMRDFLKEFNSEQRLVNTFDKNLVKEDINFKSINSKLEEKIAFSKLFLQQNLKNSTL